ncbi:uncharacterized protein LOC134242419 [Saccostrea cucullata]|uniref:uncharacterized protein LOC134242419 n=1 Tax=Saccostrea cuccullata TaxID=36930 RepID=UPI002ED405AD
MCSTMVSDIKYQLSILFILLCLCNAEDLIINTRLGQIRGLINTIDENVASVFYNIPFAKPPIGDLRFAKPIAYGSWTGILNATALGNQCMQFVDPSSQVPGIETSEDCLYLNIFVPNNASESVKKPVMVWIHGGGFSVGSAHIYDSKALSLLGDVIVVTIQYRLGIFGFFSIGTSEALGNYGLWDQMLALEWVHQNIDSFGGDPSSVTIFGESAGGASVSLLALIPQNKNRFHRVIAQSGTMTVSWAMTNSTEGSYAIGELSGCSRSLEAAAFVSCMRRSAATTLSNNFIGYTYRDPNKFALSVEVGPVVDGELFKMTPKDILGNFSSEEYKFFSSLDYMTGTVKYDGNIILLSMTEAFQKHYGFNLTTGITSEQFCNIMVPPIIGFFFKSNPFVLEEVCNEYQVQNNVSEQSRQMLNLFTDIFMDYPAFESLRSHSQDNIKSNTYYYVFEIPGPSAITPSPPPWYEGPGHADELVYLFTMTPLSGVRKNVSTAMMTYWTNFAKNGDPRDPTLPDWMSYDNQKEAYLVINANQYTAMDYKEHRMKFWDQDIPRLMESAPTGTVTVQTKLGPMTGKIDYVDYNYHKKVLKFYNIPFAKPPLGKLRFAKPVPYGSWTGTLNATEHGNQCMQLPSYEMPGIETSEDCLYLNIFVPHDVSNSSKKPVMVWIHGGGFTGGSAHVYESSALALQGDVIVVTIQYRLGIFGFFSLGKNEALGNYGLWDQMLALDWVHQNIDSFGGDPSSVTIFGESAGGASVSLLALIPQNKNKFHRVIAQSGTMTAPWATTNVTKASFAIGELVGCSKSLETPAFVNCMQNINANTLLTSALGYMYRDPNAFQYDTEMGPGIDGELFKVTPSELLRNFSSEEYKFFSSLDFMTGTMKADGNDALLAMTESFQKYYSFNLTTGITADQFCSIFVRLFTVHFFQNNSHVFRTICDEYQVQNNVSEQSRRMIDFHTDFFFAYPAFESLRSHSQDNVQSNTYHYVFELDGVSILLPSPPPWYIGPGHADELAYLFPFYPLSGQWKAVSTTLMAYWTNFAKRGDPNDPSLPDWAVYDNQKKAYLEIDANQYTALKYKEHSMQLWDQDIPRLMESAPTGTITIQTKLGPMTGNIEYLDENNRKKVLTFYNIPFAKPPVGELRFAKPVPYGSWTGTLNATESGNQCMQYDPTSQIPGVETSEDCLNLNIFVPHNVSESFKKPVMVWIHGGGFTVGSAHVYDSSELALQGDVIVVTIQYRLGIFGFFSLGRNEALGNYGLWDQMLALEWVHQNIESFGGDPSSVTIFGESAGGASVSLLALIPQNKNRFQRVIAQSGTMTASWATTDSTEASYAIGELMGCSKNLTSEFVNCMKNSDANTLLNRYLVYTNRNPNLINFVPEIGPVIDGELIKAMPTYLLKNFSSEEYKFFSSLDYMTGTVKSDGNVYLLVMTEAFQKYHGINATTGISADQFCSTFVPPIAEDVFENNTLVSNEICNKYKVKNNVTEQSRQMLNLFTDVFFAYPAFESLSLHSENNIQSSTFHYVFEFDVQSILFSSTPAWYVGPGHGDELGFMFPFYPHNEQGKSVSAALMRYWTNFAKSGNPNDPSLPDWAVYDNQKKAYLAISANQTTSMKYKESDMQFWGKDVPNLIKTTRTGTISILTKLGPMIGTINYLDNDKHKTRVLKFYNIPFAKPPVGELRFAKPAPYGSWTGTLNATTFGNQCMQVDPASQIPGVKTSEDCLNLNVFVPNNISVSSKKPVMVWIHGGGFTGGSAHLYDSSLIASQGDVIVVTIQYRLGIFGFFSLGKNEALGNYGLWDQMMALEWVHQNIDSFGGDPSSVTIFGESAGGASVSLLALIPQNKNRFHRVIAQSGTMTAPWVVTNASQTSYAIGEMVGCPKTLPTSDFVNCMRNSDANTLLYRSLGYIYRMKEVMSFRSEMGPVIDDELIKLAPTDLMKNFSREEYKFFSSLDFMTGTVKSDGNVILGAMTEAFQKQHQLNLTTGITADQFCNKLVPSISADFFRNNSIVSKEICNEYQVKNNVSEQSRQMLDLFTDLFFAYPAFESIRSHSQSNVQSNTFHYVFELDGPTVMLSTPPPWYIGPGHADELIYQFPFFYLSGKQASFASTLLKYWTNFAKSGDPNDPGLPYWPSYNTADRSFLRMGEELRPNMEYKMERLKMFDVEIPRILNEAYPIVKTKSGELKGITKYIDGKMETPVTVFHNIPYAAPPLGELRFSKPRPFGNWSGIRDATKPGVECLQTEVSGLSKSEDCLQLNIFTPYHSLSSSKKRSVMVWIHGGGYELGTSLIYDGSDLVVHGDVIVVTVNYRLGIFGFFTLNDPLARGNYGLWDQILALQWVQQNIASFGGDPSSVTIFGESAGGFSVSLLSMIPENKGLFHRVISQSGVSSSPWAFGDSEPATRSIGDLSGCSRTLSSSKYVECMRNVDANTLQSYSTAYIYRDPSTIRQILEFTPGLDGDMFKITPEEILSNSSSEEHKFFTSLSLITGTMKTEGSSLAGEIYQEAVQNKFNINASLGISTEFMCDNFTQTLVSDYFNGNGQVSKYICDKYSVRNNLTEQGKKMLDICTDFIFLAPAYVNLRSHSFLNIRTKSYQYVIERPPMSFAYVYSQYYPSWFDPPGHADDLAYIFPAYFQLSSLEDIQYSKTIMSYWTNFAKYGDPNDPSLPLWPTYDSSNEAYFAFDDDPKAHMKYEKSRINIWVDSIPKIIESSSASDTIVETPIGKIQGTIRVIPENLNSNVYVFYNIPYAKPPIGNLRFAKPIPFGRFDNIYNATNIGSACLQPALYSDIKSYSEDCLQLNIYIPNNISTSNKKSVMVWIHGGGYAVGSAVQNDGSILASKGDVIVVTVNYRLGIFGFFSLNDATSRGNYGIWDQILALRWVKDNIASFGGNPDSITIFGESAGGFSVSLLSLIPQNRGLFHRVIAQSGAALSPIATGDSRPGTLGVGKLSQCNGSSEEFIRCMRNKSAEEISRHYLTFITRNPLQLAPVLDLLPNIDNELFRQPPSDILKNTSSEEFKFFASLDLISGAMKQEGTVIFDTFTDTIQSHFNFDLSVGMPTEFVCNFFIPAFIDFIKILGNQQLIKTTVCEKYRDFSSQGKQANEVLNFVADVLFTVPLVKVLDAHSSKNIRARTFQYLVTEDYPYPYYSYPSWYEGPGHADDVGFIFQYYTPPTEGIQDYLAVSDKMIAYWSNFAKNGDPNDNSLERWPVYNPGAKGYIILDRGTKPSTGYANSRVKFWLEDLPDRLTNKVTTTPKPFVRDGATNVRQGFGSVILFVVFIHCFFLCC